MAIPFVKLGTPESELVCLTKAGDLKAYERLIRRHQDYTNMRAMALTQDRGHALTLSTNTLLYVWIYRHLIPDCYTRIPAPPFKFYVERILRELHKNPENYIIPSRDVIG